MDTNEEVRVEAVTLDPEVAGSSSTLTVTHYQDVAAELSRTLEALRVVVSRLADPTQKDIERRGMRGVSLEFIIKAITMVEATPELLASKKLDPAAAREMLQILEAFAPIRDQLRALAYELGVVMESRKSAIARRVLQIYAIAKGCARDESDPGLTVHVGDLRKQVRDRRNRGKARAKARAAALATAAQKQ
ncbi:MAG: hypothetical protein JWN02_841 [Acidobacteria bacterium]|nr:hypothetical protein [Acidobacteriota bacterium]